MNDQYIKHVGYENTNLNAARYFSQGTVSFIQNKVFDILKCTFPEGVIVPCHIITNVMNNIYESFRPPTGDIYSRFTIPSNDVAANSYLDNLVNQVISVIVSQVKSTLLIERHNQSLTAWTTLLGDFNDKGLRSHAPIKIRNKKPRSALFNMNY